MQTAKDFILNHKAGLPPQMLQMFAPGPPLTFAFPMPPPKHKQPMKGMAEYVAHFAEPGDPEFAPPVTEIPEPRIFQNTELQAQARVEVETIPERYYLHISLCPYASSTCQQHLQGHPCTQGSSRQCTPMRSFPMHLHAHHTPPCAQNNAKNETAKAAYDPATDPHVEGDAFKTLFVARLSHDTSERTLLKEFEEYGPIKRVRLVTDAEGKSKGYAFLEFEHRNDMKMAYKMADGRKIDGKRVLVDVERGRTVPDWYAAWYLCCDACSTHVVAATGAHVGSGVALAVRGA